MYQRPQTKDTDIPHHTSFREAIITKAQAAIWGLGKNLADAPGLISYTFDAWTSQNCDPFLAVTGHYIKVGLEQPIAWTLETDLLAFTTISGNHSGHNTAAIIGRVIDRYNIRHKLGWGTSYNASTNNKTMYHLEKTVVVDKDGKSTYPGRLQRVR
ncbi:hypothetical protein FRC02_006983 [Tulasnella sp. 418]|nr:hypothetical protein FRC02_006983 [Tulasnella sp. 418]